MIDVTGTIVQELRDDAGVEALVGARVRTLEPHGATATYDGDALGAGSYRAFIVMTAISTPPERRVPVMFAEYGVRCYGRTKEEATAVFGAVVDALHRRGHRLHSNGVGIYSSFVTGGQQEKDPDTQQPVVLGTIQLTAATQAVTV